MLAKEIPNYPLCSALGFIFISFFLRQVPERFLGTLGALGLEQTDGLKFPAQHLDENI